MADSTREGSNNDTLTASSADIVGFFSGFTIFLSITALLGNILILIALHRMTSIYPPTKLFFRCLAVTDLCVGLIVQPLYTTFIMSRVTKMNENVLFYIDKVCTASSAVLCAVSLLTTTAISVDRLLALLLGMRYRHVVTLGRVRVVITCFWLISASIAMIGLWTKGVFNRVSSVITVLSLVTSISSYVKIHLKLRQHQTQIQNQLSQEQPNGGGSPLNIARYKKTVSSILWVQLALVVCYAPYGVVAGIAINNLVVQFASSTLVYLNSSLNPILYCWKIREVRQAVKDTIRQLYCS